MKKIISLTLTILVLTTLFIFPANAIEKGGVINSGTIVDIEYLDNGDYIVTVIEDGLTYIPGDSTNATTTVTKTKTKNYLNSAGTVLWNVKVQGTFKYDGSTSKCTSSAYQANSYAASWSIVSASSSKSGNTATATATARHTSGVGYNDYTRSVSLTCSKTGVFS